MSRTKLFLIALVILLSAVAIFLRTPGKVSEDKGGLEEKLHLLVMAT